MTCAEALELAKQQASKGFHVFPVAISWDDKKQATNKRPLTINGHHDATTAHSVLERPFNVQLPRPGAAWGVGIWPGPSGYFVLDPDIKGGEHGDDELAALEAEHGRLDTARAVTASGGGHVYIKKPAGVHIGNADLAPGVNVRGDDGWVVAIGTRTPWGSWDHDDATPHHAIDCPRWLLDRLTATNGNGGGGRGRWAPLDRAKLNLADLVALEALEALGGHDPYIGGDGEVLITRPGKIAGSSASIGYIGPGVVKVFTSNWQPLEQDAVYTADELVGLSQKSHKSHKSLTRENASPPGADDRASEGPDGGQKSWSASSEGSEFCESEEWAVPVALGGADTPAFPVSVLPGWLRGFVTETARAQQVPVDLPAVLALAAVATGAGGRVVVEVSPGWREPLNIYAAVVLPPGERKSPVFRVVADPIADVEHVLIEKARPKIVEAQALRATAKKAAERAVNEAAKAEPNKRDAAAMAAAEAAALADAVEIPPLPRLLAEDATPEALASLMAEQGGRMAVLSDEGDVFELMAGRYSKDRSMPNLAVYLKGWDGGTLRVDRKGRPPEHIKRPALTFGLAIQPAVLRALTDQPGFRGRGLLARFLWALPTSYVGWRDTNPRPADQTVLATYATRLGALVEHLAEWTDPAVLTLGTAAHEAFVAWAGELEPRMRPSGDLAVIRDWVAKLVGQAARLAALLHLAEHGAADAVRRQVAVAHTNAAVALGRYFLAHAVAAFEQMGADGTLDAAKAVAPWVCDQETFTRRDLHQAHRSRFPKAADVDPVLELFETHGWVRQRPQPRQRGGRPPSPVYDVNPQLTQETRAQ
jgi:hypothetical protein